MSDGPFGGRGKDEQFEAMGSGLHENAEKFNNFLRKVWDVISYIPNKIADVVVPDEPGGGVFGIGNEGSGGGVDPNPEKWWDTPTNQRLDEISPWNEDGQEVERPGGIGYGTGGYANRGDVQPRGYGQPVRRSVEPPGDPERNELLSGVDYGEEGVQKAEEYMVEGIGADDTYGVGMFVDALENLGYVSDRMSARLGMAAYDGVITHDEADMVLTAIEAGESIPADVVEKVFRAD